MRREPSTLPTSSAPAASRRGRAVRPLYRLDAGLPRVRRGFDLAALGRLCEIASAALQPDLTILLDLPVPESRGDSKRAAGTPTGWRRGRRVSRARTRRLLEDRCGQSRYLVLDGLLLPADLVALALARGLR